MEKSEKKQEMEKSESNDMNVDAKENKLHDWTGKEKGLDNHEKKQLQFPSKEPIDLDMEKSRLFIRKAISSAVVILICTATSVAWIIGPSSLQYLMEVNAAQQLRSELKNDTKYMMPCICWSAFNVTMQATNRVDALKSPELCQNDTVPSGVDFRFNTDIIGSENKSITDVLLLFGIFGCIVAFVVSVFNHKIMLRFPSTLLIYWLVSGVVYLISDIVNCCTMSDYFENWINPSPLCQLKAFVSIFFGYLLAIFSLEHTLILFSGVWFPYMFKNIFSSTRKRLYLHAFAVLMAFIAPCAVCAGLIAAYVTGSVTDVVQFYYSFVPVYGVYGVMTALVGLTVWKLMGTKLQTAERHCSCTPELKLAAVFVYVVILFGASVVQNVLETYRTYGYVDDYFLCESLGTNVCTLDPDHFNGAINAFDIFSTLVFSLSPYMSLVYIMPVHLMRQKKSLNLPRVSSIAAELLATAPDPLSKSRHLKRDLPLALVWGPHFASLTFAITVDQMRTCLALTGSVVVLVLIITAMLNDILRRALSSVNVPSRIEPTGLDRADAAEVCAAANQAEQTKIEKYSYITSHAYHSFTPVAFEIVGMSFLYLGHRIANTTGIHFATPLLSKMSSVVVCLVNVIELSLRV
eukprot:Em0006g1399a